MLLAVGMTALVLLAVCVPIAVLIGNQVVQNAKQDTVAQASSVGIYLRNGDRTPAEVTSYVTTLSAQTGRPTVVQLPDGTVAGAVPAAVEPMVNPQPGGGSGGGTPPGGGPGPGASAPHLLDAPGGGVVATLHSGFADSQFTVWVYSSAQMLNAGKTGWLLLLVGGSVGMLLLATGAAELLTRRIVAPLVRTAATAQALSAGEATARAPVAGPREVADVGRALNRLADRIDQLIAEERETIADLSHRLRTPMTALRLDAEALADPVEAERIGEHIATLERMLTALIRAARRPQREGRMPACDATVVVGDRVAFWSALVEDQGRDAEVRLPNTPMPVRSSAQDLAAAVDALLENVVAHTPEGTAFAVRLLPRDGGGARLTVADEGPGLRVAAPVRGQSDRGSTGLGLDIARRCAEASGGHLVLGHSPAGGAMITLELGSP